MKLCPTCKRSFDDDSLSFCLDDGTPLISDSGGRADSQETLVSPAPVVPPGGRANAVPPTQYGQLPGKATVNVSAFNAASPPAYAPPPAVYAPPPVAYGYAPPPVAYGPPYAPAAPHRRVPPGYVVAPEGPVYAVPAPNYQAGDEYLNSEVLVDNRRYYRECWWEWGFQRCALKPRLW